MKNKFGSTKKSVKSNYAFLNSQWDKCYAHNIKRKS